MNNIPLPNELLRKIYQYIHPIFEYEKYICALKHHEEERLCFLGKKRENEVITKYSGL